VKEAPRGGAREACGMLRVRVAALCVHDGRVLLAKHVRGEHVAYLFPGGGVDPGEMLAHALARELREEAGADFEIGDLRYLIEVRAPGGERHLVQFVFAATPRGLLGASSDPRVEGCAWHAIGELRRLRLHPGTGAELAGDLEAHVAGCRYILADWRP
jgi:8-oxo-dGTP diphosphatase